ncbi:pentapeptide repeat-containing protein [Fischerella sp. PCC 9605]|uniref:pentapeptide repeat-containing protein n=1 Tax=Fischerella sp. PCC 9605 TaxID=1173024 RepID=UPI00047B242F|nr:pentapeptide repeat-containing protein [Fischerella sp. PCC 9605]
MPLDFSGQNLRGRSFEGRKDLEGANFSRADIRGADFTNANLRDANFSYAKAGLQCWSTAFLIAVLLFLSGLAGYASGITGVISSEVLFSPTRLNSSVGGLISSMMLAGFFIAAVRKGFTAALVVVAGIVAGSVAILGAVLGTVFGSEGINAIVQAAWSVAGLGAWSLAGIFTGALTVFGSTFVAMAWVLAAFETVVWVSAMAAAVVIFSRVFEQTALAWPVTAAVAMAITLLGIYTGWRTLAEEEKFISVRQIAVAFAATGGTSFPGADLTDAHFTAATLKNTDLRKANITRTRWHQAKKLDLARVGKTYLDKSQVRQLVITGVGQDKNFDGLNLRGVNLRGANLVDASFIGANLSEANLQDADLSRAKLKQTQLDGTDLTGATLTGAFIEDWGITSDTKFDGVRCEYVYMRLPTKENPNPLRKPDNLQEVFADGEFGDFIKPIVDTLDLYHNQGVDPRAIAIAFKRLAENNPNAELEIVAMEKRGQDKFLLRAKTAETANKSELSAEYFETYNQLKGLPEGELRALIAEKNIQIRRLTNMVMTALERPSFYTENRTINMSSGNYNEDIQGDYVEGDSLERQQSTE